MKNKAKEVSTIRLQDSPYQREVHQNGERIPIDSSKTLDAIAADTNYSQRLPGLIRHSEKNLYPLLEEGGYYGIDAKLKNGKDLTFAEAFSLITFVCGALNKPLLDHLADRI